MRVAPSRAARVSQARTAFDGERAAGGGEQAAYVNHAGCNLDINLHLLSRRGLLALMHLHTACAC